MPVNPPQNTTYCFIRINADASSLDMGRSRCFQMLALDRGLMNTLTVTYNSTDRITATERIVNGAYSEDLHQQSLEVITTEGQPVQVQARIVDEYFEPRKNTMTTLYQVALVPNAVFDNITLTTSYASDPTTWGLSLIPGAAQIYKGSFVKGAILMGGSVALTGGIVVLESMRKNYIAKIAQTHSPDVKKAYNNLAGGCATGRNICVGAAAALYVYNVIDAIVAPGARRVIVTPATSPGGQYYGLALNYNF